jgi:hypothetical protein
MASSGGVGGVDVRVDSVSPSSSFDVTEIVVVVVVVVVVAVVVVVVADVVVVVAVGAEVGMGVLGAEPVESSPSGLDSRDVNGEANDCEVRGLNSVLLTSLCDSSLLPPLPEPALEP